LRSHNADAGEGIVRNIKNGKQPQQMRIACKFLDFIGIFTGNVDEIL
jgi:hypothetical protein